MRNQITSFSNDRVKSIIRLRDKRSRDIEKKFVIEGYRENLKAIYSKKISFDSLYICPECFLGKNEESLIEKFNVKIFELPRKVFEKISYRDRPDGILSVATIPDFQFPCNEKLDGEIFLIIEGVEKPGNLGTILRTAEGGGVNAVIVANPKIDLFNPNVIRSSTGTLFTIPTYISEIESVINFFRSQQIQILAISPDGNIPYYENIYDKKTALVFGSEQYGLSQYAKENSDRKIFIPMKGEADSLNLAMSCGIVLYEVLRQRATS
ncbi:MAG: RNA methyltransferase [Leptospiraceae bacterium]|nr:RNA methyltransferase [Leptospiraceae bacterium]MCK6379652.1 RNA methyltransferase [Leptospiraceae bacterium]NUM40106.1 RNA methyltransferase [Leptospiraceae bacterium]